MLLFLIFTSALAIISPADYIYQKDRPKVAAHRGLCSVFPENTLQAFDGAMNQGTDFLELDVQLNKENKLIVAHDAFMSGVSNIKDLEQFKDRKRERYLKGALKNDWWIIDFTEAELKQIGIKQVRGPKRSKLFDGLYTYPTLEEVLAYVTEFNELQKGIRNPDNHLVGILIEMKDYQFHKDYAVQDVAPKLVETLKKFNLSTINDCKDRVPIVLMSFDVESCKEAQALTDLPRVQLMTNLKDLPISKYQEITKYANIMGVDLNSIWNPNTQGPYDTVSYIRNAGMLVYGWTFQDDVASTTSLFRANNSKDIYQKAIQVLNIDGLITEFPEVAISYAQAYRD